MNAPMQSRNSGKCSSGIAGTKNSVSGAGRFQSSTNTEFVNTACGTGGSLVLDLGWGDVPVRAAGQRFPHTSASATGAYVGVRVKAGEGAHRVALGARSDDR